MSHWEAILRWITKYNIKSILDAPCGSGSDHGAFRQAGVERILGIDLVASEGPDFLRADLTVFHPDRDWDTVYINCIFCSNVVGKGDHAALAKNYASWPVRYILLYDTPGFNRETHFLEAGWRKLEDEDDGQGHGSRQQMWGK